jgi:hypothetical protein
VKTETIIEIRNSLLVRMDLSRTRARTSPSVLTTVCVILACTLSLAMRSPIFAAALPVPNGSFEHPDVADGSGIAYISPGVYSEWQTDFGTALNHGHFGFSDPNDARFPNTTGNGILPSPADGTQFGELSVRAGDTMAIISASPITTISANNRYTLSVAAGNEIYDDWRHGTLWIFLLAGNTPVASSSIAFESFPVSSFQDVVTSFNAIAGSQFVGQPLYVRIAFEDNSPVGDLAIFDNVRVDVQPIPEPASLLPIAWAVLLAWVCRRKLLRAEKPV